MQAFHVEMVAEKNARNRFLYICIARRCLASSHVSIAWTSQQKRSSLKIEITRT